MTAVEFSLPRHSLHWRARLPPSRESKSTRARGPAEASPSRKAVLPIAAFTLIEILIVIGLIGVFMTLFVMNIESLVKHSAGDTVESSFWEAARTARTRALLDRVPQAVRFDKKSAAFVIEAPGGANVRTIAIDRKDWAPETRLELAFMKRLASNQLSLVQGQVVDLREIPQVQFYPDGTCTPFVLSMTVGKIERQLEIDPWTGAQMIASNGK